ncbi:MAG: BatD family protein [Opitutaceae bacterium]|nr:BatD family protein [Opitutaceae bacterium]
MRLSRLFFPTLLLFVLATVGRGQSVRWEPADGGMPNTIILVYENCEPDGQPELPVINGVTFTFQGRSESSQSTFGPGGFNTTRSIALSYTVRGRQGVPVQIPTFTVKTSKGPQRVPAFNVATPAPPLESVAGARLLLERNSVWAGEVFALNYELSAARRTNPQISPTFDWNAAPLVAEDWSKPEVTEAVVSGDRRVNVLFRSRAVAKTPNTIKLEAANHLLSIQTGTIGFGIISQPRMEQVSVTSDQPTLEVRALPPAPPGFSGAVGQFKLTSKVVPEKAAVGEPVTWTLELSGTGNWPDVAGLPAREVSNDFQVVQPKAKRTPAEGKLFDVTLAEDVVLVPSKPGNYTLGAVSFIYFEPKSGTYKTITAPRTTLAITAPTAPQFIVPGAPQAAGEPGAGGKDQEPVVRRPPTVPAPPAGIPRDPLPGTGDARVPVSPSWLLGLLLAPCSLLLGLWGWLALRQARQTDPVRPRREARDRLAATLARLATASGAERTRLLQAWQRDAAALWQIAHAAPPSSAFAGGVASPRSSSARGEGTPPAADATWATLWEESERALYSAQGTLSADWVTRARAALAAVRVPGFQARRLFLPQNLMPFAAGVAALTLVAFTALEAAEVDALAAYRKSDFAAAEKSWRAALARTPTNWIARHNLSLALAQQDRAGEAAAQAVAAFVQKPDDPAVRWHFALAAEKSGSAPAPLNAFLTPGPRQSLARLTSAGNWQVVMIAAAWCTLAALGWLLWSAYAGRHTRVRQRIVLGVALGCLLVGSAALASVRTYGLAARAESVVVARPTVLRSIPTEADTAQKTTPLAAGSLALSQRTFLGWTQLAFENGQTGWVRKDEIVPLWK